VHFNLGDAGAFSESMSVSPMDLDVGDDLILSWYWISSHDLLHLYQAGQVDLRSGLALLQLARLPPAACPPQATLSTVIGHGEFRRLLRQIVRDDPSASSAAAPPAPPAVPQGPGSARPRSKGWSRPAQADHAELAAVEAAAREAARERRSPDGRSRQSLAGRFVGGTEVLRDGT
jgi:hypothetical protein